MKIYVPPNGFVGAGQQTQAAQLIAQPRTAAPRRRRKTAKKRAAPKRKRATRRAAPRKRAGRKLVKGSAAAKRYMAKLRRMRKK